MILLDYYNELETPVHNATIQFDHSLDLKYRLTDFSKQVVKTIDDSTVLNEYTVDSKIMKTIPYESISSGAKGIICMKYTDYCYRLLSVGENCFDYIAQIGKEKDLHLVTFSVQSFYRYIKEENKDVKIKIINTGDIINNDLDLLHILFKLDESVE